MILPRGTVFIETRWSAAERSLGGPAAPEGRAVHLQHQWRHAHDVPSKRPPDYAETTRPTLQSETRVFTTLCIHYRSLLHVSQQWSRTSAPPMPIPRRRSRQPGQHHRATPSLGRPKTMGSQHFRSKPTPTTRQGAPPPRLLRASPGPILLAMVSYLSFIQHLLCPTSCLPGG